VRRSAPSRRAWQCSRIDDGGKLDFVRKFDFDVGDRTMLWMGMVPL
jgi:hypothetical protein